MSESRWLCSCCTKLLISAITISLILYLSFRFTKPRYYLLSFSILPSSTVSFLLQIENKNRQVGIHHDNITLTLLSAPNLTSPISRSTIPSFYQGHLKTAEKPGNFSPAATNLTRFAGHSSVFELSLESGYRFRVLGRKTRRHAVRASCTVEVDGGGEKTAKKGIRLSMSGAAVVRPFLTVGFLLYAVGMRV